MAEIATKFSHLSLNALDGNYHSIPDDKSAKIRRSVERALQRFKAEIKEHQSKCLPNLKPRDIPNQLDERTWRAALIGHDEAGRNRVGEEDDDDDVDEQRDQVGDKRILPEIGRTIQSNRGTELQDEVNPNVMRVLFKKTSKVWGKMATDIVDIVVEEAKTSLKVLVEHCTLDLDLQKNITLWLSECLDRTADLALDEIDRLCDENELVMTWNPLFLSLIGTVHAECISGMVEILNAGSTDNTSSSRRQIEKQLRLWFANNKDVDAAFNAYVRLKAYYIVAMSRFIDNVGIQVVERHLLGRSSPLKMFTPLYMNRMADEEPEKLKRIAGENADKETERKEINKKKSSLEEALAKATTLGYLGSYGSQSLRE